MNSNSDVAKLHTWSSGGWISRGRLLGLAMGGATTLLIVAGATGAAASAQPTVGLGTAAPFAVLAGTTVTNVGNTDISGDIGLSPGSSVTGFPPGTLHGAQYVDDPVAVQAKSDLTTAYLDAAGRTPVTTESSNLGGLTLGPGVYAGAPSLTLTGTLTLDAHNNPDAVFIFQAPSSTLITSAGSVVQLTGGAQACNVFWQVGSSATLSSTTTFVGTVLALTSVSAKTGATVSGRLLAQNGAVTLEDNTITVPTCTVATAASSSPTPAPTAVPTQLSGPAPTVPSTGASGSYDLNGIALVLGGALLLAVGVGTAGLRRRDS